MLHQGASNPSTDPDHVILKISTNDRLERINRYHCKFLHFHKTNITCKKYFQVSICDSHQHLEYGAMIAQAPRRKLKALCEWVAQMFCSCFNSHPDCYELSFLYFRKSRWRNSSSNC